MLCRGSSRLTHPPSASAGSGSHQDVERIVQNIFKGDHAPFCNGMLGGRYQDLHILRLGLVCVPQHHCSTYAEKRNGNGDRYKTEPAVFSKELPDLLAGYKARTDNTRHGGGCNAVNCFQIH